MNWLSDPSAWVGLITLTVLEIVLGVDNIIFISILAGKLPKAGRAKARTLGLLVALVSRIALLLSIGWVSSLTAPIFTLSGAGLEKEVAEFSGRDLVLLFGGLFLIYKAVKEIHQKFGEDEEGEHKEAKLKRPKLSAVLMQIMVIDIVFSLDSVITAVGMVKEIGVMISAVVIAVGFMMFFSGAIADFVDKHPTIKMLALSFLVLIGVNLVGEGCGQHVNKNYTYFAMAFAVLVELLNIKLRKKILPDLPEDAQL